jgi:membrane protease YdiL (CAAX protease family)
VTVPDFDLQPTERHPQLRPEVWFAVWAIILLMIGLTLASIASVGNNGDQSKIQQTIQRLSIDYMIARLSSGNDEPKEFLQEAAKQLQQLKLETKGAKGVRNRYLLIINQTINPKNKPDFSILNADVDDIPQAQREQVKQKREKANMALQTLYSSEKLSLEQANSIKEALQNLGNSEWPISLALEKVNELSQQSNDLPVAYVLGTLIFGGMICWIVYMVLKASRLAPARGVPLQNSPKGVGDQLGLRFLGFLLIYLGAPVFVILMFNNSRESPWQQVALSALMLGLVFFVATLRIYDYKISLNKIGLNLKNLKGDILWGIGGYLANWPVLVVLLPLGMVLFRWIPSGQHPITEQLTDPDSLLPAFLLAGVLAPIMEEFVFRGLFFQGMVVRMRKWWGPMIATSIAFAAIHPQGGAMWLALGWVGAMGCILTYQRGSLIPAMVMHALHNTTVLLLAISSKLF